MLNDERLSVDLSTGFHSCGFPGTAGALRLCSLAMDVTVLRNCIQSTLDPNADARRQAELDLKYVCYHGFTYPLHSSNHFGEDLADTPPQRQKTNQASQAPYLTFFKQNRITGSGSLVCFPGTARSDQVLTFFSCRLPEESSNQRMGTRGRISPEQADS